MEMLKHGTSAKERFFKNCTHKCRRSVILLSYLLLQVVGYKSLSQIKDHNDVSGNNKENWEYFDDMDAILGTKPPSPPIALIHSGGDDISQVPTSALNSNEYLTSACIQSLSHDPCATLDNNDEDLDETQAEDPDLTYVPENDHSLVIPESLEQEGWCSIHYSEYF